MNPGVLFIVYVVLIILAVLVGAIYQAIKFAQTWRSPCTTDDGQSGTWRLGGWSIAVFVASFVLLGLLIAVATYALPVAMVTGPAGIFVGTYFAGLWALITFYFLNQSLVCKLD